MPVDGVVAKIRFAADKPSGKRRPAEIAHATKRLPPMNCLGLLSPELLRLLQGTATEFERASWLAHGGMKANYPAKSGGINPVTPELLKQSRLRIRNDTLVAQKIVSYHVV